MQLEYGGRRISVAAGEFVIGSDAGASLRLAGPSVRPRHAVVRRMEGGHLVLEPTGDGPVKVNGVMVGPDPTPLLHGDRIGIEGEEVVVVDPSREGATRVMGVAPAVAPQSSSPTPVVDGPPGRVVSLHDGREYPVAVAPFVFGRDAAAQVVIGSPDASRRHAEIVALPDGDVLVDLSANGTFVNGQRVSGRHRLKALDVVRIGAEEFRYYPAVKPPPPPAPPAGAEFRLGDTLIGIPRMAAPPVPPKAADKALAVIRVKKGPSKGERHLVRSPTVSIGRGEFNEVRLTDAGVSASHARLQLREGVWFLVDLGSTNGTQVDGVNATEETPLSPGATISLGGVLLTFEPLDEAPVHPEPTRVAPRAAAPVAEPAPAVAPPPRPRPTPAAPAPARSNPFLLAGAIVLLLVALAVLILVV